MYSHGQRRTFGLGGANFTKRPKRSTMPTSEVLMLEEANGVGAREGQLESR